ncbi:YjcZ family sporulation protein [Gottfriedia luciferensis]|nr:YjcZ family sporulation protein [Gottfriedia luciferensis]
MGKGVVSPEFTGFGHGRGFALIVVLFILLIIVGCAFVC